ncbi:hypothetical protein ACFL02_09550 [Planctomycetota bacterium]
MSDYYPGEIHIGGPVPQAARNELIKQIVATGASLEGYCGGVITEETTGKALLVNKTIDLYADKARYGRFEELEDFLVTRGIHFNLHCEAYCEYEAEKVFYRGGKRVLSLPSDQSGNLLVCFDDVIAILDNEKLDDHSKLEALRKLIIPPETKPLEPIRFV